MLTYDTIQKIGSLLGMEYINYDGKCNIPNDASDGTICMSGNAKIIKSDSSKPPLLIITGIVSGHQYEIEGRKNLTNSIYVLNLNTLKPTKNSYRQIQLPLELQNIIQCEIKNKLNLF